MVKPWFLPANLGKTLVPWSDLVRSELDPRKGRRAQHTVVTQPRMSKRQKLESQAESPFTTAAGADDGDAVLVLHDATLVRVHSALLAVGSSVMRDAVHLAQADITDLMRIPLPSTSAEEADALVAMLYSQRPDSYACSLPLDQLLLLHKICHRLSFEGLLGVIDTALTRHTGSLCPDQLQSRELPVNYLTPQNATELYWEASSRNLGTFQAACARYIGSHIRQIAEAAPSDALGPIIMETAAFSKSGRVARQIEEDIREVMLKLNMHMSWTTSNYSLNSYQRLLLQLLDKAKALL